VQVTPQSGEKIRVLIVDDIAETRENLRKLLSFDANIEVVGAAASGQEGIALVKEYHPHVVLMDINMPGMDGITATEIIQKEAPATQVVMLSVQGETDYLRRAMMAGARDFLTKPPSGDELMSTIRRVYEMGKERMVLHPAAAPSAEGVIPAKARQLQGEVVAVFSPKGGVGCTTVAVNLAIALQKRMGSARKVCLLDANVQFGNVGVMLNMQTNRSLADLAPHVNDMDSDLLNSVMVAHGSGIKVLLAPPDPETAEAVLTGSSSDNGVGGASVISAILELMRTEFDIVVVDMWNWLDDISLTILDTAALILLVIMPNIPSIKNARLFLEVARRLNYLPDKIALVLNGVDRRMGFGAEQIERALTVPIAAQIPLDEQAVLLSVNYGVPFIVRDESRPISQSLLYLADYVRRTLAEKSQETEKSAVEASRVRSFS
jgi:pilus assembly protein CpaE